MVSASLVLYHNKQSDIEKVINSILSSKIDCLCIVDHSSNDDFKRLEGLSDSIHYLHTKNDGYGKGHNIGFEECKKYVDSKYHIVINPDIYFEASAIDSLIAFMNTNENVGLVMPKIFYPNGDFQFLCKLLPTPKDIFLRQFASKKIRERNDNRYAMKSVDFEKEMDIPSLSGCFMFFRSSCFEEIDGFDMRFFMHFEDIDITRRISKIARTVYYPHAIIIHAHEAAHKKNKKMFLIGLKSAIKYFNKWGWIFDNERVRANNAAIKYLKIKANR